MKKILELIDVWGLRIVTILSIFIFIKGCTTGGKVKSIDKNIVETNKRIDSLTIQLKKEIKIEGLKSEKRMIQSTDRRILDVNRQTEIDNEITNLQK